MGALSFDARLYLVAPHRFGGRDLASVVPDLAAAGVDALQLREKEMEAGDVLNVAGPILEQCRAAGIPFILNDRPDLALFLDADGVHVGQNDVPVEHVRRLLPDAIVGWSTHARSEIDAAAAKPIEYHAVGPVYETPTKPGRPSVGLELVRYAAANAVHPWFAIGGIDERNLTEVLEAGARRIVVVRAITEASDPVDAAARLRETLDAVPIVQVSDSSTSPAGPPDHGVP
jgi:thiamine-phosphate pyrophosphorylase